MYSSGRGRGLSVCIPGMKRKEVEQALREEIPPLESAPFLPRARGVTPTSPGPKHGYGHGLQGLQGGHGAGRGILALKISASFDQQNPGSKMCGSPTSPVTPPLTSPAFITPVRLDSMVSLGQDRFFFAPPLPHRLDLITVPVGFRAVPEGSIYIATLYKCPKLC